MDLLQAQQQLQRLSQRRLYSGKRLAILAVATVVSTLLICGDYVFQSNLGWASGPLALMGLTIYLLVITNIMVVDWRGFLTMNGLLKWNRRRFMLGCLFVGFNVFFLGFYLAQAYSTYRLNRQLEPLQNRRKIAEQEAALGMIPQTEGHCQKCHQPLQLGAEFCAYCRERVIQRPRICPVCYSTTLPDARWCPACGSQIDMSVLSPVR